MRGLFCNPNRALLELQSYNNYIIVTSVNLKHIKLIKKKLNKFLGEIGYFDINFSKMEFGL